MQAWITLVASELAKITLAIIMKVIMQALEKEAK